MHTLDDFSARVSPPPSRSGDTKLSETPDSTEAIFLLMSNKEYGFGECGVTIFLLRFAGLLFGVILQCRVVVRWKVTPSQYEIWLRGRIFNCVMPAILYRKLHNSEEHKLVTPQPRIYQRLAYSMGAIFIPHTPINSVTMTRGTRARDALSSLCKYQLWAEVSRSFKRGPDHVAPLLSLNRAHNFHEDLSTSQPGCN